MRELVVGDTVWLLRGKFPASTLSKLSKLTDLYINADAMDATWLIDSAAKRKSLKSLEIWSQGLVGDDLMALKTVWDYAYYWGALAKLFFCKGYADGAFMAEAHPELLRASVLNTRMQRLFRDMSRRQRRCGGEGGFFDHHEIGSFHTLKQQLLQEDSHGAATGLRTVVNYLGDMAALLETVAGELAGGARLPAASRFGQVPLVV